MSLTYTTYVAQVANLMVNSGAGPNWATMLPGMIDYAEQRIYRELDLAVTTQRLASSTVGSGVNPCAVGSRYVTMTPGTFVVIDQINIVSPPGSTPDTGTRNALTPASPEFMDLMWNNPSIQGVPTYMAAQSDSTYIVGPWPDKPYTVEVVGNVRPSPLSQSNSSTFLTTYLPDLFVAASMVFGSGYMRNFGSQSDDPKMSQSWESQYQTLKASANEEELRKKWAGPGWGAQSEVATPQER